MMLGAVKLPTKQYHMDVCPSAEARLAKSLHNARAHRAKSLYYSERIQCPGNSACCKLVLEAGSIGSTVVLEGLGEMSGTSRLR